MFFFSFTSFRIDMFLSWRARWKIDGMNTLDSWKYKVVKLEKHQLFTKILVDVGNPPKGMPSLNEVSNENFLW